MFWRETMNQTNIVIENEGKMDMNREIEKMRGKLLNGCVSHQLATAKDNDKLKFETQT